MIRKIALALGAWLLCASAGAVDGVSLELGRGEDRTSLIRLGAQWHWRKYGYWELAGGVWDNRDESTTDFGFTPVFRLPLGDAYVEGGIGVHLVTRRISAARVFSTAFQFGDHVGAGMRFGRGRRYDLGMRLQHLSNAGIRRPNPGINFLLVRLQYDLE